MSSYDFDFRPVTYWPSQKSAEAAISRIKGMKRRRAAAEILAETGRLPAESANGLIFAESLSDSERDKLGKIHRL